MKRSTDRILPTHTGSLQRPDNLIDMMREKESHRAYYKEALPVRVHQAVLDTVRRQRETGIDIPGEGEQSKSGFGSYQSERVRGFRASRPPGFVSREREAFAEEYAEYFSGRCSPLHRPRQ